MPRIRLALIGDHIALSRAPELHRTAGRLAGIEVTYDLLVPAELGGDFDRVFAESAADGVHGINVTHPYKERAAGKVRIDDPRVRAIGAVNTVLFPADGPRGFNTDHSGFVAAYRRRRGDAPPGAVCLMGAGGAGKAVAFGLLALGLEDLRIVERDLARAEALVEALRRLVPALRASVTADVARAAPGATGLVNCTPVGMYDQPGTVVPAELMAGAAWAFDAVYTPVATTFLNDAEAAGLAVVSGWELFFFQGLHAWALFAGRPVDEAALRAALATAR